MALQLGASRDALLSAGSSADNADKAAADFEGYEGRFAKIEADFSTLKWMMGSNLAFTAAVPGKLLLS